MAAIFAAPMRLRFLALEKSIVSPVWPSSMRMGRVGELAARLDQPSIDGASMANLLPSYQTYLEQDQDVAVA